MTTFELRSWKLTEKNRHRKKKDLQYTHEVC